MHLSPPFSKKTLLSYLHVRAFLPPLLSRIAYFMRSHMFVLARVEMTDSAYIFMLRSLAYDCIMFTSVRIHLPVSERVQVAL